MNCSKILDMVYDEEPMPLLDQIQVWLHTVICSDCARNIQIYENAKIIMKEDFFPSLSNSSSQKLEDSIMARIGIEEEQAEAESSYVTPGGISTRGWVIAGLVILVSMASAFFGFDFKNVAYEWGMSFMLPLGITVGIILTTYGALFIGSHLKEFSERFGL
jgi:hypothetical protein